MSVLSGFGSIEPRLLARRFRDALIDIAFPRTCAGCGSRGTWVCTFCDRTVPVLSEPLCHRCGMPQLRQAECWCKNMPPHWSQARSPYAYRGWAAGAIRQLKYFDETDRASHMAAKMLPQLSEMGHFDAMIPVPLHASRLEERGFNQAEVLAQALSNLSGVPVRPMLVRTVNTPQQARLSREDRLTNVDGAFAVAQGWVPILGERYLLIDDVRTTGATLRTCVTTLVLAGAGPISALTFALDLTPSQLTLLGDQRA